MVLNIVVAICLGVGALARWLFRHQGGFHQVAGEQAPLIDDVTGTLPPYKNLGLRQK